MKIIKLLFVTLLFASLTVSCSSTGNIEDDNYVTLEQVVRSYDLWYVDIHKTQGSGEVPFIQNAFTLSFINGNLYANNNLAGIGSTGNGLGVVIGTYNTNRGILEINHSKNGYYNLEVILISNDIIKLRDNKTNVTYYLEGYKADRFDYNKLFFENIEYFLQEYNVWEKVFVSKEGTTNAFDNENFLAFEQKNTTTFYASRDKVGTAIANLKWNFTGKYEIFDVNNTNEIKILTLNYNTGDKEEFELSVINDETVQLYHVTSKTTYKFQGREFLQYLRPSSTSISKTKERNKIIRKSVDRKYIQ